MDSLEACYRRRGGDHHDYGDAGEVLGPAEAMGVATVDQWHYDDQHP
jgi:hypothetical protein